jgi:hypothetical protein
MTIDRHVRLILAVLAAALTGGALSGCSLGDDSDPTYTPAAYYQTVGGVYECYYTTTTQEAYSLMAAGLCPAGSMPTPMPLSWEEMYWSYWSSPAYYNTYLPVGYRSTYTRVTIVHFSSTYKSQISAASSKAVYKSSAGGTVSGSKVNTTQFGSGSRATKSYGGGSRSGSSSGKSSYSGSRSAGRK